MIVEVDTETMLVDVRDYVVVHVGFAISRIDEEEAHKVFRFLEEMDELGELDVPLVALGDFLAGEQDPQVHVLDQPVEQLRRAVVRIIE